MPAIAVLALWLAATTTVLGQQRGSQSAVQEINSGTELVRALAAESGAETLLLVNDYTEITEDDFTGFDLPIVIRRSMIICGRKDRWAAFSTSHTRSKFIQANNVTLTQRWIIALDMFGDVSSGATAALFVNMPDNETSVFLMEQIAYVTPFCYPPAMTEAFLGQAANRPPGFPGKNLYNASVGIPASLMAMGGGQEGANAVSEDSIKSCTNDTRAPPMRRCWGHVAYLADFAVKGTTFDASRQIIRTGYVGYILETYMLCAALLDAECIFTYTAYGCLQRALSKVVTGGGGGGSNGSVAALPSVETPAAAPSPGLAGPAAPAPGRRSGAGVAVLVGVVVGGFAAVAVAAALIIIAIRRRRRQQGTAKQLLPCSARLTDDLGADTSFSSASPVATGGGAAPLGRTASTRAAAGKTGSASDGAGGGAGNMQNSSECDMESDLAGRPSRTQQGATPHSSDIDDKASLPVADGGRQAQQQQEGGNREGGGGGGARGRNVVVTPFTPLRPDLQMWQDPAKVVTLLPVVRGKGSYGKVCEGLYGGERVAVKLVRDTLLSGGSLSEVDKIVTTFAQEVEVLGRCHHANVVRLLAACMQPPRFCLVMELMDTSLQRLVFGQAPVRLLPVPKVLYIGCEIARALEYLHPTIVHRDLKPDNVLISNADSPEPIVKVSDFGLSRIRCTVSPTLHPEAGTPPYMAPECFDLYISCITHHVDIYSWAVVMWTMLSGVEPWIGCGVVEIAYRVTLLDERLLLDDSVASGRCPPRLQRLLTRCWNRTPERRPAAAEVVKEMLLIMQQHERPAAGNDLDANFMASPGSVLFRIREYQDAAAAATTTTAAALADSPVAVPTTTPPAALAAVAAAAAAMAVAVPGVTARSVQVPCDRATSMASHSIADSASGAAAPEAADSDAPAFSATAAVSGGAADPTPDGRDKGAIVVDIHKLTAANAIRPFAFVPAGRACPPGSYTSFAAEAAGTSGAGESGATSGGPTHWFSADSARVAAVGARPP